MNTKKQNKIVYKDGEDIKVIIGVLVGEDDFFISILRTDGNLTRIGKSSIVSIKERSTNVEDRIVGIKEHLKKEDEVSK